MLLHISSYTGNVSPYKNTSYQIFEFYIGGRECKTSDQSRLTLFNKVVRVEVAECFPPQTDAIEKYINIHTSNFKSILTTYIIKQHSASK
jgi:hypothetical protein